MRDRHMNYEDEIIKERMLQDDELFSDAFLNLADSVMGTRLSSMWQESSRELKDALNEIVSCLGLGTIEIPDEVTDINEQIDAGTQPFGVMHRGVKLTKGWYRDAYGPMLASFRETGKPVALLPGKFSGYVYYDGDQGKQRRITGKNADLFSEEAIVFYDALPLKKLNIGDIFRFILKKISMADLIFFLILALAVTGVGMVTPVLNRLVFSNVIENSELQPLFAILAFMIAVSLSSLLLSSVKDLTMSRVTGKIQSTVQAAVFARMLLLPARFFKRYSSTDLSTRMSGVNTLFNSFLETMMSTVLSTVLSLVYFAQMSSFASSLALPAFIAIFCSTAFSLITVLVQTRYERRKMKLIREEKKASFFIMDGIQKIRTAGAEKRLFNRWASAHSKTVAAKVRLPLFLRAGNAISSGISILGTLLIYAAAVKSNVSVSDYYAFMASYGMLSGAFSGLAQACVSVSRLKPVFEAAKPILDEVPEVSADREIVTSLKGQIEIDNVSFRYGENMPYILRNLSLKIEPGQYVAIVGKTGCGKSTLMRLLLGFEKPETGSVYYDGKDLNTLDLHSLRRKMGVVIQDGKLFTGDIYSNIVVSAPWLSVEEAWEVAETAGIADDIRAMPMGMNTMLSEGGGGLSGGQKQRLLIARAIAPKPSVIFMDEATSALDNVTQKLVSDSLEKTASTRIVIAHRLSTILNCDRIIVLNQGEIVEDGTYDELVRKNGYFAELVNRQRMEA